MEHDSHIDQVAGRVRPPVIFGASQSLLRVYDPDELAALADRLPAPAASQSLASLARQGRSVLLEHPNPDVAAATVVAIARRAGVPLIWVSAPDLVSSELAFPQRAMSAIIRYALRLDACLLYVHDFDAIARPQPLYPSHYARRATHDVVSAMGAAAVQRSGLMLATSASPGTLDRSVVNDRFDVAVRLEDGAPTDRADGPLTDVA